MRKSLIQISIVVCLALSPSLAVGQSVEEQVITQLRGQGFEQIQTNRTLLGRIRVVAESATHRRELVFVPETGVILRDYWVLLDGTDDNSGRVRLVDPNDDNGGNAGDGAIDDDDDDDDGDDDDDDDD